MADYKQEIAAVRERILVRIAELGLTPQITPASVRKVLRGQSVWRYGPTIASLYEVADRLRTSASELLGGSPPMRQIPVKAENLQAALEITIARSGVELGCSPSDFAEIVMLIYEALAAMETDQPTAPLAERYKFADWLVARTILQKEKEKDRISETQQSQEEVSCDKDNHR